MGLPPDRTSLQRWTFLVLIALAGFLFWKTAEPLWVPLFLGLLVAVGTFPLYERLVARSPRRQALSAAGLTGAVMVVSLGVFGFVLVVVSSQLVQLAKTASTHYRHGGTAELLGTRIVALLERIGVLPDELAQRVSNSVEALAGNVAKVTGTVLAFSVNSLLVLIFAALTSYYLLREGRQITQWLVDVLPLPDGQVWELARNFRDVTQAMLLGTGVTALYQGSIAFFGYLIAGVPSPVLWASLTGVASLLPGIGTALVWAPIAIYLFAAGAIMRGLVVIAWGALLIVGVADYILRPRLLGSKVRMNELLVFIAIFGGIEAFGLLGLILGPIFTAVFVSLVRIYQREYRPR